jgi:hypothetical protein
MNDPHAKASGGRKDAPDADEDVLWLDGAAAVAMVRRLRPEFALEEAEGRLQALIDAGRIRTKMRPHSSPRPRSGGGFGSPAWTVAHRRPLRRAGPDALLRRHGMARQ